jgi:hypothetical protein
MGGNLPSKMRVVYDILAPVSPPGTGKGAEGASSVAKPRAARQSSNLGMEGDLAQLALWT